MVYKSLLHPKYPNYIKRLFKTRTSKYMIRSQNLYFGVNKTKNDPVWIEVHYYLAAKSWNLLTGDLTTIIDINKFKTAVGKLDFSNTIVSRFRYIYIFSPYIVMHVRRY